MRGQESWAVLRPFPIVRNGVMYLFRLNLLLTPWRGWRLHWILRRDPDTDFHDHPWDFKSYVLFGHYTERVSLDPINDPTGRNHGTRLNTVRPRWFKPSVVHKAEDGHRIIETSFGGCLTLVVTGKWRREWGFWQDRTWVHWKEYLKEKE